MEHPMESIIFPEHLRFQEVKLMSSGGIPAIHRFAFYDQVHTTGMDIQHKRDCVGAITLGKDMVFRDYAQGAYRLRGIGKGQKLRILIIPEVRELISKHMLQANATAPCDVCGWLVLNSMLSDRLQFNVLQTQNLSNIWRKNAWNTLMEKYALLQLPEIVDCIEVFKEPIDFQVLDHEALQLSETEDGLMRKCCRRALDLFTAEGNVQGAGAAGQLNQDRRVFTRLARSAEETPFARRRFFEQIGGCRRRAVGDWAERPIAVALTVPSEPPGEGDHAIVTELGKEQLAHSSGPPALDRAISGTTGGDPGSSLAVPPALNRATSGASGGSGLTVGRPPSMKREISRKPELSQGERDSISNRLQEGPRRSEK
eukprot:g3005.t1